MAYLIEWVDQVEDSFGPEVCVKMNTPAGLLYQHWRGDVICSTTWFVNSNIHDFSNQTSLELKLDSSSIDVIPVKLLKQGSLFQQKVWAELLIIPSGKTLTYSEIAVKLSSSPRAVGNACRANPYPFLIPCHRVVAVSSLGGYSGQTVGPLMVIKETLLSHELMNQA